MGYISYPVANLASRPRLASSLAFFPEMALAVGHDRFPMTVKVVVRSEGAEAVVKAGIDPGLGEFNFINKKIVDRLFLSLSPMSGEHKPRMYHGQGIVTEIAIDGTNCSLMGAPVVAAKALDITGDDLILGTSYLGALNATVRIDMSGFKISCSGTPPPVDHAYAKYGTVGGRMGPVTFTIEKDGKSEKFSGVLDAGWGPGVVLLSPASEKLARLGLAETSPEDVPWLKEESAKWYTAPKVSIEGVDGTASDVLLRDLGNDPYLHGFEGIIGYDFFRKAGTTMRFSKEGWSISLGREKGFLGVPNEAWAAGGLLAGGVILYTILSKA